jgi:hypothetical protein
MGLFGSKAAGAQFDPGALSPQDRMMLLGATLRDTGAGLSGGAGGDAVMTTQALLAQRQQQALQQGLQAQAAGLFGGQAAGGSRAIDPRAAAAKLAALAGQGLDISPYSKLVEMAAPKIQRSDSGVYEDFGDPAMIGKAAPKAGEGQFTTYGRDGAPQIQNAAGYVPALAASTAAQTGAQEGVKAAYTYNNAFNQSRGQAQGSAPYDFINVPTPNGAPRTISKEQAAGGVFTGQAPGDQTYGNDIAKAAATQFQGIQTSGQQAPAQIARFKQIDRLLGDYEGGKFAPQALGMASALNSLGLKMDPKMSNAQAADAVGKQLVLELNGGSLGTGFSNADREFLEKTVPGILQGSGSRRQLIQMGVATAQRKQDVAQKARAWQQRFGRIDAADATGKTFQDYLDGWSAAHPVFGAQ